LIFHVISVNVSYSRSFYENYGKNFYREYYLAIKGVVLGTINSFFFLKQEIGFLGGELGATVDCSSVNPL
jgi:hypothetical protein